jgi:hypothetical protein
MRIVLPYSDNLTRNAQNKHKELLTEEYMQNLSKAIQNKFPDAKFDTGKGSISVEGQINQNISYYFRVFVTPEINMTFTITITGNINSSVIYPSTFYKSINEGGHRGQVGTTPFQLSKTVFPEDNQTELADWIWVEVSRKSKQASFEFMKKYPNY